MASFSEVWKAGAASSVPCTVRLDKLKEYEGQRPSELAHFTPNLIMGGTLTEKLFDKPSIGNAAVSTMKLQIVDQRGLVTAKAQELELGARMKSPADGITYQARINRTFCVASRRKNRKTGGEDFVLYDRMIFAEAKYEDQVGTYKMPAADVVAFIAQKLGLETDESNEIGDFLVDSPTGVYTMREVLRFIAAGSGGNFIVSADNKLKLVPFGEPVTAEEQACSELDYADDLVITGVRLLPDSETQYFSGTEDGFVVEGECAYATQALCDAVAAKLIGKVYRAFEAKDVRLSPETELGSSIRFGGKDFVLASVNWTIGPAMAATVGAPWAEDEENEIPYQSRDRQTRMTAQSFSEIRKSTEKIALEVQGKVDETKVNSLISVGLNGITLSAEEGENKCTITLTGEGLDAKSVVAEFSKIIADEVSADGITAGTILADSINTDGSFCAGYTDRRGNFYPGGYMGYTPSTLDGSDGVHLTNESEDAEVRVTPNGAALECGWSSVVCTSENLSLNAGTYASVEVDGWTYEFYGGDFYPAGTDQYLGTYSNPWEAVYAETGSILSSDERKKKDIVRNLSRYREFFRKLIPACGKMVNGTSGRTHIYFVAQDVENAMGECGLTDLDFAGFVKSPVKDKDGNLIDYIYALRYEEFIPLIVDAVQQQETRLARIEQALNLQ